MAYLVGFINILTIVLSIAIIIRSLLSWVNLGPSNPLVVIVYQVTEPILAPIRRLLPNFGSLDLAPIVAIILLIVVRNIIGRFAG